MNVHAFTPRSRSLLDFSFFQVSDNYTKPDWPIDSFAIVTFFTFITHYVTQTLKALDLLFAKKIIFSPKELIIFFFPNLA